MLQVASRLDHAYDAQNEKSSDSDQLPVALQHSSAALSISPVSVLELPPEAEAHYLEEDDVDELGADNGEKEEYESSSQPTDDKGYSFSKPVTGHCNRIHEQTICHVLSGFPLLYS